jgi:hypothetical protein
MLSIASTLFPILAVPVFYVSPVFAFAMLILASVAYVKKGV